MNTPARSKIGNNKGDNANTSAPKTTPTNKSKTPIGLRQNAEMGARNAPENDEEFTGK